MDIGDDDHTSWPSTGSGTYFGKVMSWDQNSSIALELSFRTLHNIVRECKSTSSITTEFLNVCHGGESASISCGIMLKNNNTAMEYASYIYGCDDFSFNVYDSVNILCK